MEQGEQPQGQPAPPEGGGAGVPARGAFPPPTVPTGPSGPSGPSGTSGPSGPAATGGASAGGGLLTTWPAGKTGWTVVLTKLKDKKRAQDRARAAARKSISAGVISGADYV